MIILMISQQKVKINKLVVFLNLYYNGGGLTIRIYFHFSPVEYEHFEYVQTA